LAVNDYFHHDVIISVSAEDSSDKLPVFQNGIVCAEKSTDKWSVFIMILPYLRAGDSTDK